MTTSPSASQVTDLWCNYYFTSSLTPKDKRWQCVKRSYFTVNSN